MAKRVPKKTPDAPVSVDASKIADESVTTASASKESASKETADSDFQKHPKFAKFSAAGEN